MYIMKKKAVQNQFAIGKSYCMYIMKKKAVQNQFAIGKSITLDFT